MGEPLFSLQRKDWESDFFAVPIGSLQFTAASDLDKYYSYPELRTQLTGLLEIADARYHLLEIDIDVKQMFVVPLLEEHGFRLVDSRCSFLTFLEKDDLAAQMFDVANDQIEIRDKTERDLEPIIDLTVNFLVNDTGFLSRYKNGAYFSKVSAERYFCEWVRNAFRSPGSIISVAAHKTCEVVGFFIYEKRGSRNDFPLYRAMLSVVNPEFRRNGIHLAMQSFILKQFGESGFYIDNTTQLANVSVIRNHIKSHRSLNFISLILWRENARR